MFPILYLTNDDQPTQFSPREMTIVRKDVFVEGKQGLLVTITPTLEHTIGGPLREAILVPRHKDGSVEDICSGQMKKPTSVFVCRLYDPEQSLKADILKEQVAILFWGLVSYSAAT
jgi:hypothetical protein